MRLTLTLWLVIGGSLRESVNKCACLFAFAAMFQQWTGGSLLRKAVQRARINTLHSDKGITNKSGHSDKRPGQTTQSDCEKANMGSLWAMAFPGDKSIDTAAVGKGELQLIKLNSLIVDL